ncbi:hypothetical protein HAX54_022445 [Datura stramonium]|uniref:Uncharacterized protein n=1 Tax=Datura stramonium TaxID=4076 RepID=A0ABS8UVH9_DATST|nr:hypothetical protein [Datura stramonium]
MMYSPYGYATYPPDYYHQGMYNPAAGTYQQAAAAAAAAVQYYQQMYGSSSSAASPYYYGYSMHGSRGTFSAATQRFQAPAPSYLYYPPPPTHHLPAAADPPAAAAFSSFTPPPPPLLQHPPTTTTSTATRIQFPSPTTESQISQQTSGETTEVGAVTTTESPNT